MPSVNMHDSETLQIMPRKGGELAGMITIAEDFDAPLPDDLMEYFKQDECL